MRRSAGSGLTNHCGRARAQKQSLADVIFLDGQRKHGHEETVPQLRADKRPLRARRTRSAPALYWCGHDARNPDCVLVRTVSCGVTTKTAFATSRTIDGLVQGLQVHARQRLVRRSFGTGGMCFRGSAGPNTSSGITKQVFGAKTVQVERLAGVEQLCAPPRRRLECRRCCSALQNKAHRPAFADQRQLGLLPMRGQAGRERQVAGILVQAVDRLDGRGVHPCRRPRVPAPATAPHTGSPRVHVAGHHVGLDALAAPCVGWRARCAGGR